MNLRTKIAEQIHRVITRNSRSGSDFEGAADAALAVVVKRLRQRGHWAAVASLAEPEPPTPLP